MLVQKEQIKRLVEFPTNIAFQPVFHRDTTWRSQRNHRVAIEQAPNSKHGRQYSQHTNKWSYKQDVNGTAPERSTVAKRHAEQNQ